MKVRDFKGRTALQYARSGSVIGNAIEKKINEDLKKNWNKLVKRSGWTCGDGDSGDGPAKSPTNSSTNGLIRPSFGIQFSIRIVERPRLRADRRRDGQMTSLIFWKVRTRSARGWNVRKLRKSGWIRRTSMLIGAS